MYLWQVFDTFVNMVYAYCGNDPINRIDPQGTCWDNCWGSCVLIDSCPYSSGGYDWGYGGWGGWWEGDGGDDGGGGGGYNILYNSGGNNSGQFFEVDPAIVSSAIKDGVSIAHNNVQNNY